MKTATTQNSLDTWTLIPWDGNPALNLQCWRKRFPGGCVSVGAGEFLTIVYSYGANSGNSMSGTRWRKNGVITEQQAMDYVDAMGGHARSANPVPSPEPLA